MQESEAEYMLSEDLMRSAWVDHDYVWTTKDGQKIPYEQLTGTHLLNIIYMLRRQLRKALTDRRAMLLPESVALEWERGISETEGALADLEAEAESRGLQVPEHREKL